MLKYSTYKSIYSEDINVQASGNLSPRLQTKIQEVLLQKLAALSYVFRRMDVMKIVLVLLLVISGFTVVGNVFAGSVQVIKQDVRVVVEPGDTLWSIALKNKPEDMKTAVYIEGIMKSNGLKDSGIKAGDVLIVPQY
ncbi:LysM peptidoglycan-binding domain-containing protein [Paenibacillus piscarius]|uniref:LysM peptidoglycan-binding domain-containing protein n=1 Tax=Paenibacillus piscarius TaxID=1089681 RepID=UPI001EE95D54|nr:LysM peptidoglycan-binding domain-containing protein [Paenibacillus piscarius]